MIAERKREPLVLTSVQGMVDTCTSSPVDFSLYSLRITWDGVLVPAYNADSQLDRPDEFMGDLREAVNEHKKLRSNPDYKVWGRYPISKCLYQVHLGLCTPMTMGPWIYEGKDDTYLTVTSQMLHTYEITGCTQYIKLSEHQRIVQQTRLQSINDIKEIVSDHVQRGVEAGVAQAVFSEASTLKDIKNERQRIETEKIELESKLMRLNDLERKAQEREKTKQERRRNVDPLGYVYLLQTDAGYWKIGRTKNPDDRLRTFGVKLPYAVEYAHLIPCADMFESERVLHARYAAFRVNGSEFFRLTPAQVDEIKSISEL